MQTQREYGGKVVGKRLNSCGKVEESVGKVVERKRNGGGKVVGRDGKAAVACRKGLEQWRKEHGKVVDRC